MVRAFDDQRLPPFYGMARCGAEFTKTIVHAVIYHTLFFGLNQQRRRRVVSCSSQNLFACQNTFTYPVVGGAANAQPWLIRIEA